MIETEAIIVKTEQNVAFVETQRKSGCGHCDPQKSCATSTLSKFFGGKPAFFKAINPVNAIVGDIVVIGVADGAVLKSAMAIYLMPLIFVLIGAGLANFLTPTALSQDLNAMIGAASGLFISYIWIKFYTATVESNKYFQPVVLRKVVDSNVIQFVKEI